ncbi:MAG: ribosome maturation factor RimP [Firmicutes bacterium]|nr:ribosome maturation factor RimP [Bacillota bacterium]MBQ4233691.1 ribosome maturation factor RimP [Bacillota bacterium]MBR0115625.1 ribosome maturation factor RimP [Bacillota bacterium]
MAKKKIGEYVSDWMEEFGRENPYELSRCEFVKEGSDWYLRVYVDKLEGEGYGTMSTDDCELVSRYLSDRLDKEDPIKQNYYLEVSSPGMDRPLLTEKDFRRFMGELIEIRLYKAENGSKTVVGKLAGYDNGDITVELDKGKTMVVEAGKAAKVNLAVVF